MHAEGRALKENAEIVGASVSHIAAIDVDGVARGCRRDRLLRNGIDAGHVTCVQLTVAGIQDRPGSMLHDGLGSIGPPKDIR